MAFNFPDPNVEPLVVHPVTGITYAWKDNRWVIASELSLHTDQLEDIVGDITDITARVGNLETGLEVTNTTIDQEVENRGNLIDAAASKNNQQDASINELDARLDALSSSSGKLEFKGTYTYVIEKTNEACLELYGECLVQAGGDVPAMSECNRLKEACEEAISDPYPTGSFTSKGTTNVIADIEEFLITTIDANGQTIDWLNTTEEGDYLEFFDHTDGDTALYEVVDEPSIFNTEQTIRVKFINQTGAGDGKFNLDQSYDIRIFKAAQGIDLTEADARYVLKPYVVYFEDDASAITPVHSSGELKNGELWYDTSSLEMFVWNNNAWVAASPPPAQDIVISSALDDISRISGDVTALTQDVNSIENFLETRKSIYYSDNAPAPVGPDGVTSTLKDGDIWVDGNELELKFYSQNAWINPDRTTELPEHHHYAPANLRWRFTNNTEATPPPDGQFKRDINKRWRFSFKTYDGIDLGFEAFDDTDTLPWQAQMSVWYKNSDKMWKLKAHYLLNEWRWNYMKDGIAHVEFKQENVRGKLLTDGVVYNVTIGGWW